MRQRGRLIGLVSVGIALAAAVAIADDKRQEPKKNAAFEALKTLVGDWVLVGEDGKPTDQIGSSFSLTAGGSVLRETLFPGTEHEMLTVYYLEGDELVLTHYCVLGNQPHMKAAASSTASHISFECTPGGRIHCDKDSHMHTGIIDIVGPDRLKARWRKFEAGEGTETAEFELVRKKS